jgi:hypothetical protein
MATSMGNGDACATLLVLILLAYSSTSTAADTIERGPVNPESFPFLVSVNDNCSGAIISHDRVLTAAHCVANR